jgi:fluoride exporter
MERFVLIAAGGSAGAIARYLLSGEIQRLLDRPTIRWTFPWGTMVVNVLGCLLMGVLAPLLLERVRPEHRDMVLIGFLGAFTTWSSFGYEVIRFVNDGQIRAALTYLLATNVLCLSAVWFGYRLCVRLMT